MNPVEILRESARLEKLLVEKGFTAPKIEVCIGFSVRELTANIQYKAGSNAQYKFIHLEAIDGFEALFVETEEYINKLQSVIQIRRDAFTASVGRLIDEGKEIGIQLDFLNPLTEMMTKLSSNIITDQSAAVVNHDDVPF